MLYACRVSRAFEELVSFWDKIDTQLIVYEHTADDEVNRTHCHFLLETTVSTDTLKNWIKQALDLKVFPRTDWSFKTTYKDDDDEVHPVDFEFITYMSKGNLDANLCQGFDETQLESYKSKWKPTKKYKGLKQFKLISEKPETQRQRVATMLQPVIDANHHTYRDILDHILQVIKRERIVVGRYKIRDYFDYVVLHSKRDVSNDFARELLQMFTKF